MEAELAHDQISYAVYPGRPHTRLCAARANAVPQVGNMMTALPSPWFALQTTGSAAKTGITNAAIGLVDRIVVRARKLDRPYYSPPSVLAVPSAEADGNRTRPARLSAAPVLKACPGMSLSPGL
jgi:hypothetical protein